MESIRHTRTLSENDGPQLFEALGDDGAMFRTLMIERAEGGDRHPAVESVGFSAADGPWLERES